MEYTTSLQGQLTCMISDNRGNPQDSAREILDTFVVIPQADLPEVKRSTGTEIIVNGYRYGTYVDAAGTLFQTALRALAALRFLELEAESEAEAKRIEEDTLLREAYELWRVTMAEPMAQWEFEILVHDAELEIWKNVAIAARKLHASD